MKNAKYRSVKEYLYFSWRNRKGIIFIRTLFYLLLALFLVLVPLLTRHIQASPNCKDQFSTELRIIIPSSFTQIDKLDSSDILYYEKKSPETNYYVTDKPDDEGRKYLVLSENALHSNAGNLIDFTLKQGEAIITTFSESTKLYADFLPFPLKVVDSIDFQGNYCFLNEADYNVFVGLTTIKDLRINFNYNSYELNLLRDFRFDANLKENEISIGSDEASKIINALGITAGEEELESILNREVQSLSLLSGSPLIPDLSIKISGIEGYALSSELRPMIGSFNEYSAIYCKSTNNYINVSKKLNKLGIENDSKMSDYSLNNEKTGLVVFWVIAAVLVISSFAILSYLLNRISQKEKTMLIHHNYKELTLFKGELLVRGLDFVVALSLALCALPILRTLYFTEGRAFFIYGSDYVFVTISMFLVFLLDMLFYTKRGTKND